MIRDILITILEFFYNTIGSYGVAIFLLVLVIKVVIFPLTAIGQRATMKTQLIQPEMKAINEKYKDNPTVKAQKTQELYAEHDISPFSALWSCVSLLASWPIVIALFALLNTYFATKQVSFLWVKDITETNHIEIAILVAAIQLLSMYITTKMTSAEQPDMMKYLPFIMALFIGWLAYTYPVSLGIYWFSFSLVSIIEQILLKKVFLRKHHEALETHLKKTKNNSKKGK